MSSSVKQPRRPYKKFTPEEDEMILEWSKKSGKNWNVLAEIHFPGKNGRQLSERYKRITQKTGPPFTEEEQKLLIEKVEEYGHKWQYIAEHFFPHHNEFTLKNRYYAWKRKCARPKKTKPRIARIKKPKKIPALEPKQENQEEQRFDDNVIYTIIPDDLDL